MNIFSIHISNIVSVEVYFMLEGRAYWVTGSLIPSPIMDYDTPQTNVQSVNSPKKSNQPAGLCTVDLWGHWWHRKSLNPTSRFLCWNRWGLCISETMRLVVERALGKTWKVCAVYEKAKGQRTTPSRSWQISVNWYHIPGKNTWTSLIWGCDHNIYKLKIYKTSSNFSFIVIRCVII